MPTALCRWCLALWGGSGCIFRHRRRSSLQRFYSLSAQIQRERKAYYAILERSQKATMDATEWLIWFLQALLRALEQALLTLDAVLHKTRFWQQYSSAALNTRQLKVLKRLLEGFEGKLTSSKWAAIAKCSPDTALRDMQDLLTRGVLLKADAGGRSTSYTLAPDSQLGTPKALPLP